MAPSLSSLSPFNCYLFEAVYRWMLMNDLDPAVVFRQVQAPEVIYKTCEIYEHEYQTLRIDYRSVKNAEFSQLGFHCTVDRGHKTQVIRLMWSEIFGLLVGPDPAVKTLADYVVIFWDCNADDWNIKLPSLRQPLAWLPQSVVDAFQIATTKASSKTAKVKKIARKVKNPKPGDKRSE